MPPSTIASVRRGLAALLVVSVLAAAGPAVAGPEDGARAFLARQHLDHAAKNLGPVELAALGRTLQQPRRRLKDRTLASLLRNPVAWKSEGNARELLGTIIRSLPGIADVKGINSTMKLASNPNPSNFRGYGVELVGAAALNRYITADGQRARVTRMGGMIKGLDGRRRESDGSAVVGADGVPRLVTIKSVSTEKAVSGAMRKAADQLALRNLQRDGTRRPGVILVGYDSPAVRAKLQRKNWQAAADRSGAKLLVLGIDQRTGATSKLASFRPDPNAKIVPKRPGPRPPVLKRFGRFMMRQIGRRHPPTAKWISRQRGAFKRTTRRLGQRLRTGVQGLFGRRRAGARRQRGHAGGIR